MIEDFFENWMEVVSDAKRGQLKSIISILLACFAVGLIAFMFLAFLYYFPIFILYSTVVVVGLIVIGASCIFALTWTLQKIETINERRKSKSEHAVKDKGIVK